MKLAPACIVAGLALMSAGCVLSAKKGNKTAATPAAVKPVAAPTPDPSAQPLSIPQTQVELPHPQPVDPEALSPDTPPPVETASPARVQHPLARPRPERRAEAPAAQPAAQPAVPEQPLPQIQEIVPPAEARRLQEAAQARRREVQQILDQLGRRRLTTAQHNVITNINAFLISSLDAEKRGDMKLADALADRAQVLAKDLIDGK